MLDKEFWQGWSIGYQSAEEILKLLNKHKPKKILDLGSGYSTVMFALWAKDNDAEVISLEQSMAWLNKTKKLLAQKNISANVHYAPLVNTKHGLFYDYKLPDNIDFALIDGPAWTNNGRKATFHQVYPHLAKDFVVWVDDAFRDLNREAINEWVDTYGVTVKDQDNFRSAVIT